MRKKKSSSYYEFNLPFLKPIPPFYDPNANHSSKKAQNQKILKPTIY